MLDQHVSFCIRSSLLIDFFPLPTPYVDFAIVALAREDGDITPALRRLEALGFYVRVVGDETTGSTVFVAASSQGVNSDEYGIFGMSGIGMKERDLIVPSEGISRAVFENIDPETGTYTTFDVRAGCVVVKTDLFGYGHSFTSQHDALAIVSNRLHLHKIVMAAFSQRIRLNPAAVIANFFSDHGLFTQQSALKETLIDGVRLVPMSSDVVITNASILWSEKDEFVQAVGPQKRSYAELIDAGTQKVIENSRAVVNTDLFDTIVLDLSGGKDSRLVFGAVTRVPGWEEKARVNTSRVPNSDDVEIAAGLVHAYGASYFTGDMVEQHPLTLEDNLRFWRSYFFGEYHRMAAGAWSNEGKNRTSISMGGANGEIFRSFWAPVLERHIGHVEGTREFAERFITSIAVKDRYAPEQLGQLVSAFAEELESYPSSSVREKVEDHYMFNRNRSHCGLRGFTFYHDRLTWYPLLSADLLAASRSLSYSERASNRVIYDVLVGLDPELATFRFDGPKDPFEALRDEQPYRVADESTAAWEDSQRAASAKVHGRRSGREQKMAWPDLATYVAAEARMALRELRCMEPSMADLIPLGLEGRLDEAMLTPSIGYQLSSRILAVWDAVSPVEFD
ncbi:hypothetical protein [Arthrobacter sp. YD2]|uniref:hypothetical protein n=1 Tax=Arthrobacter sp. YD2 TaxID=3058046 RepID=UPI0025B5E477|nr:hypothetical protein [Arthrobacter sp. YD2]MDN3904177.1 hypothetical protein [Arthrobacter sp. YD2]